MEELSRASEHGCPQRTDNTGACNLLIENCCTRDTPFFKMTAVFLRNQRAEPTLLGHHFQGFPTESVIKRTACAERDKPFIDDFFCVICQFDLSFTPPRERFHIFSSFLFIFVF